jgi:SAM-dependent methyltransferase
MIILKGRMENNLSLSFKWWMNLVECPWCGEKPFLNKPSMKMECRSCSRPFEIRNNELEWIPDGQKTKRYDVAKGKIDFIKRALNPLSNPLLPMRYLSKFRTEQYYQRTLSDQFLAEEWADHYLSGIDLPKDAVVLDHGCGRGRNVGLLNQIGYKVSGQDMIPSPWWERLPDSGFQVVPPNYERLPWKSSSYDLASDIGVIGYLPRENLGSFVKEVKRILKPGGYWLILEANDKGYSREHFPSKNLLPLSLMRSLATQNGFREIDVSYEGFYAPFFPFAINFLRKQCGPWPMNISDYDSWMAEQIPPEKRGLWLLRLRRED